MDTAAEQARSRIKESDIGLERHRAALEAGGHSATIARWIAETEAQKAAAEAQLRYAAASYLVVHLGSLGVIGDSWVKA